MALSRRAGTRMGGMGVKEFMIEYAFRGSITIEAGTKEEAERKFFEELTYADWNACADNRPEIIDIYEEEAP